MNQGWLNITQSAAYAGIDRKTMAAWINEGLKHSRIGTLVRVKPENIDAYIENFEKTSSLDDVLEGIVGKRKRRVK
jgi:excisionase family DNA binding protein